MSWKSGLRGLLLVAGTLAWSLTATASPISYGDFSGAGVDFLGVVESSGTDPTPLFGMPSVLGSTLDFDPVTFNSGANGGSADITDGTLSLTLMAQAGLFLDRITLSEAGDYTLTGLGGMDALAAVGSAVFLDVIEVDGVAISPVAASGMVAFTPSDGDFTLQEDGPAEAAVWSGALTFDLASVLTNAGIEGHATKVRIVLDNVLATASEEGSAAFIAKKDFDVSVRVVPEPASIALLALGMGGLLAVGRRRQR